MSSDSQYIKMTETPIPRLIITLSIPTVISMLVNNIYNMVDTAFVGRMGNSASGAVGIVFGFMAILQAIGFMLGQGSGSILSRKLGAHDKQGASVIASTGFFTAFSLAIVVEVICLCNLDTLVYKLGSTSTIAPYAKTYIFYILLAAPFTVSSFTLNNILRYEGKAVLGMVGLMTGAILNIFGDAVLMFKFDMGISGAGISTAVSQIVSFCILLSMFLLGKTECKLSFKNISLKSYILFDILGTGFPSFLRQALNSITTVLLNMEAGVFGDQAVAAMSIVSRIVFFTFSISLGIGQGFQPVSGFNYGARKYDRLKKAYSFTCILSEIVIVILGTVLMIIPEDLIRIFRDDMDVINIGKRALRLQAMAQLFLPFCMTTEMMFQSTGKKLYATIMSALRNGILFIPTLLILAKFRGISGIQEAQPLAYILAFPPSLFMAIYYFKNVLGKNIM